MDRRKEQRWLEEDEKNRVYARAFGTTEAFMGLDL